MNNPDPVFALAKEDITTTTTVNNKVRGALVHWVFALVILNLGLWQLASILASGFMSMRTLLVFAFGNVFAIPLIAQLLTRVAGNRRVAD